MQRLDGSIAPVMGGALWMALSAPAEGDPVDRHRIARIRLFWLKNTRWHDLGPLLPDGFGPGSREWSGSAVLNEDGRLRLFFTAAGHQGEVRPSWAQRIVQTSARLATCDQTPRLHGWTSPQPIVLSDGCAYHPADQIEGAPGTVKAFRDPAFFLDPADATVWMLFAASLGRSQSPWNGAIGVARAQDATLDRWALLPPLVTADGIANELERPHMIARGGAYYLFWSTLASVFAPRVAAPTGLYAMVGRTAAGPFEPVNGSGLVLANPRAAPEQAYSWLVLPDWSVASFAAFPGVGDLPADPVAARACFAGGPAPLLRLEAQGTDVRLVVDRSG